MTPVRSDARLALLCDYAEATYQTHMGKPGMPPPDPRLAPEWIVRGTVLGKDALFRGDPETVGDQVVFYGWLLESAARPGVFVLVIRGTAGIIEWLEDAEFFSRPYPGAGRVEDGFFGVYQTMRLADGGAALAADVAARVGSGALTVTGHSLGATLAAYAAFELAAPGLLGGRSGAPGAPAGAAIALPGPLSAVLFAPPRPGDRAFGDAFAARLPGARAYAYEPDIVPRVPFWFGFAPLPGTVELPGPAAPPRIRCSVTCNHHALSYATLIDPEVLKGFSPAPGDERFLYCIEGASPAVVTDGSGSSHTHA